MRISYDVMEIDVNVSFEDCSSYVYKNDFSSSTLIFKGRMINRILHSWSFHMKFMKLAEGSFHKFHMKWPLVLDHLFLR